MMADVKIKKKMLTLKCELCSAEIGLFDPEVVRFPIKGHMFESIDERHGFPPPFHPSMTWEEMRCPMCRYRPFYTKDSILTTEGPWQPEEQTKIEPLSDNPAGPWLLMGGSVQEPTYECGLCHKKYKTLEGFTKYHKCPNLA